MCTMAPLSTPRAGRHNHTLLFIAAILPRHGTAIQSLQVTYRDLHAPNLSPVMWFLRHVGRCARPPVLGVRFTRYSMGGSVGAEVCPTSSTTSTGPALATASAAESSASCAAEFTLSTCFRYQQQKVRPSCTGLWYTKTITGDHSK